MPKKDHTEEQIVGVLRQVEAGARVVEVCRKAGISEAIYVGVSYRTPGRLHWACPADSETAAPSAPLILENRIRSEIWTRQIVLKTAAMLAIFSPGTGARGVERRPLLSWVKNQSRSRASLLIATISATSGQSLGQSCLAIDRPGCSGNWHG